MMNTLREALVKRYLLARSWVAARPNDIWSLNQKRRSRMEALYQKAQRMAYKAEVEKCPLLRRVSHAGH